MVCDTKSLTFHWNENACALGEPREGCRNSESMKVLKCKRHKIYLKVKYESSGAPIGCNQTRVVGAPSIPLVFIVFDGFGNFSLPYVLRIGI